MQPNPLQQLAALGQSVWLDDIRRRWLVDGTLAALIEHDGLTGLTSNPAIFEPVPTELATLGLDIEALGEQLQAEGIRKFAGAYQQLLAAVDRPIAEARGAA